jgi:hypothetical protein
VSGILRAKEAHALSEEASLERAPRRCTKCGEILRSCCRLSGDDFYHSPLVQLDIYSAASGFCDQAVRTKLSSK